MYILVAYYLAFLLWNLYLAFGNCVFSLLLSATMSLLNQRGAVRDWAPPGWHWEVLPSGARSLVRNRGLVVDPELLWWRSRGPLSVQREPPPQRVYVAMSGRRMSTSVATCICWIGSIAIPGRFFRGFLITWAMTLWGFLIFGCAAPAAQHSAAQDPVEVSLRGSCMGDVLVILFEMY